MKVFPSRNVIYYKNLQHISSHYPIFTNRVFFLVILLVHFCSSCPEVINIYTFFIPHKVDNNNRFDFVMGFSTIAILLKNNDINIQPRVSNNWHQQIKLSHIPLWTKHDKTQLPRVNRPHRHLPP